MTCLYFLVVISVVGLFGVWCSCGCVPDCATWGGFS